ncbi:hypothetical protein CTEN210_16603 [Chaetoceros tenuissimus]|uniref:Uncharacterized protein n=1 Tax=Chaetoceros tenuissimus TaxID=426638 RepID=A0AAD3D9W6_9STRA|nr:hypothetical protein CTEN210_16603 [Chaetoceros tenuissimus]
MYRKFILYLSGAFFLVSLLIFSIPFNPNVFPSIDKVLLLAPDCTKSDGSIVTLDQLDNSYLTFLWELLKIFSWFHSANLCRISESHIRFRCHFDFQSVGMSPIFHWDKIEFREVKLYAPRGCNIVDRMMDEESDTYHHYWWNLIPYSMFSFKDTVIVDFHQTHDSIYETNKRVPTAEISSLVLNWHDFVKPVVDMNVSGVCIHLRFQTEMIEEAGFKIPLPTCRIGNFSISEVIDLIPSPPDREGLYPRLGVTRVSNVTVLSHIQNDEEEGEGGETTTMLQIPNDTFVPLYDLTKNAGPSGVDQTKIDVLVREAIVVAMKNFMTREGSIIDTFHHTSSTFVETVGRSIEALIHEGGDSLDKQVLRFTEMVDDVRDRMEKDWSQSVHDSFHHVAHMMDDVKVRLRREKDRIDALVDEKEDQARAKWKSLRKDVFHNWELVSESLHEIESKIGKKFEANMKEILQETKSQVFRFEAKVEHTLERFRHLMDKNTSVPLQFKLLGQDAKIHDEL